MNSFCQTATKILNPEKSQLIEKICIACYERNKLTDRDIFSRKKLARYLQYYFQDHHPDNAKNISVQCFGSTINGFGFRGSDLDMFVEGISANMTLKLLRAHYGFQRIKKVPCRVPLVTFMHRQSGFIGDLSFNNKVGVENSRMLCRYSEVSQKCRYLVYTLKYLAKCCHISYAGRGFLSSYTYTLMVIHYLQQLEVPLLPVLQQLYPPNFTEKDRKNYEVDSFDAYYFQQDNDKLKEIWPGFNKNTQSVSELFLGLLKYYAEFDFTNYAISIHQHSISKILPCRLMMIVDPFERKRNLAVYLNKNTTSIIRNVLANAYEHFNKPPPGNMTMESLMKYFFDPKHLLGESLKQHWYFRNQLDGG